MDEFNPAPGSGGIADRLIRRLRVSDPPEKFQRRAATALRDALGFEAVAWVPDATREPIIQAGSVEGLDSDGYRTIVRCLFGRAFRIVEASELEEPLPPSVKRFVVASADGDSGRLLAVNPEPNLPSESDLQTLFSVASLIVTQRANARIYSDLKDLLFGVIRALTSAIDAKDPYTSGARTAGGR